VLRDHPLFRSPLPIDVKKTVHMNVPDAWKDELRGPGVDVIPLVHDPKAQHPSGWCTYTYEHDGAPELEVVCGGINSKTPRAGAVWRQGHLLHFGFDLSPPQMNDTGRALLVNAIAYIARFTEDRPVVHTPCVFVQGRRLFDRGAVGRLLARPGSDLQTLQFYVAAKTYENELKGKSRDEVARWYRGARDYLRADKEGKLAVDEEARSFGVPPAGPRFITGAADALDDPGRAAVARRLLARYAPNGPGDKASAEQWRSWWQKNRDYLFFSDTGNYHWYLDPLAAKRGVPTAQLRGPARATLAASPAALRDRPGD
jgi:hypothetical protein